MLDGDVALEHAGLLAIEPVFQRLRLGIPADQHVVPPVLADVAKARSYEIELKVDLGKVLDKVDSAKLEDKLKIIDTVTKLSEKGESASFLNVAMFHICMMAGAGKLTDVEASKLMSEAIEQAAKISKPTGEPK